MDLLLVAVVALLASALTLMTGFGLGTLLLPAFALFFPLPVAVAATAVVHLVNNLFKAWLVGRAADWAVVWRFGLPALLAALAGAWLLSALGQTAVLTTWHAGGRAFHVTVIGLVIGLLIAGFSLLDVMPEARRPKFPRKALPIGGVLSGFFGGLSGHQGTLRASFLIRLGLAKEVYIGTGVMCAVIVDLARLAVYGLTGAIALLHTAQLSGNEGGSNLMAMVATGCVAAMAGAIAGQRLVKKVSLRALEILVGVLLAISGVAIAAGAI